VLAKEVMNIILIYTEEAHDDEPSGLKHVRHRVTKLQKKLLFVLNGATSSKLKVYKRLIDL
jgi:hypothetical protein